MRKELYAPPRIMIIQMAISAKIATSPTDGSFRVSPGDVPGEEYELI